MLIILCGRVQSISSCTNIEYSMDKERTLHMMRFLAHKSDSFMTEKTKAMKNLLGDVAHRLGHGGFLIALEATLASTTRVLGTPHHMRGHMSSGR